MILKRIWLIIKITFKIGALIFGMAIYSLWMIDLYNIFVIDENPVMVVLNSARSIPIMEIVKNYAQDMFFRGEHAAAMIFPCLIMSIPLLRLIFIVLFRGFANTLEFVKDNLYVDYVYVDTGKYAFTTTGEGPLVLVLSLLIRFGLVIIIINISPILLILSLPINIIQLFRIRTGGMNHE